MGYVAITFTLSGILTPLVVPFDAFTSVTYTMLASASPIDTLLSVALAFSSFEEGLMVTPAFASDWAAYFPHGTWSAHSTTTRPDFWRPERLLIFFGFPFSTAICRRF